MSSNNALHFKSLGFSLMMSKLMTSIVVGTLFATAGTGGKYSKSSNSWTSKIVKNSIIYSLFLVKNQASLLLGH